MGGTRGVVKVMGFGGYEGWGLSGGANGKWVVKITSVEGHKLSSV